MNDPLERPHWRADVELLAQAAPGFPDRHVARDPQSGLVLELSSRDAFICRQLDGATSLAEIQARFQAAFGMQLARSQLEAFVRQLDRHGLLVTSSAYVPDGLWATMRPLPVCSDRLLDRLTRWFGWGFSRPALAGMGLLALVAMGILSAHIAVIWDQLLQLPATIAYAGESGLYSFQTLFRIALVVVLVPFLRELAKGVACRRKGYRVPELRYLWYMRLIPRCASDLSAIARIPEKSGRLAVAAAGIYLEMILFCGALLAWELAAPSNPLREFAFSVSVGTALGLILNSMPLGRQDGSALLMIALEWPEFRERALRLFHAWILLRPPPEPLPAAQRKWFILYGALADLYTVGLNGVLLFLAGFLLTRWLEGLGALLFVALVLLRFETEIRRFAMKVATLRPARFKTRSGIISVVVLIGLAILFFVPYPYEVGGEFRVQPHRKAEVRSEVKSQIETILVDEGAWVTNGQPLILLSRRLIERDLEMNRAALERERNILLSLEAGPKPEDVARAEQEVKVRETAYDHAARRCERQRDLYEKKHISQNEYEEYVNLMNIAREELELARRQLELTKSGPRPDQIAAQRAEVQRLQVSVSHLEEDLARTVVTSPLEGRIVTLYLKGRTGQPVDLGTILAVVEDNRLAAVRIAVPEQYTGLLTHGARVRARPWAYPGALFKGEVSSIAPVIVERTDDIRQQAAVEQERGLVRNLNTPAENVVPVMALLDNQDGRLKSEMTGYAKIEAGHKPLGIALLSPLIRFFSVRVWSWIP